jgi:replicative DNA helicase
MPDAEEDVALPYHDYAEIAVLGACLLEPEACATAIALIQPGDFFLDSHRRLFGVISAMTARGLYIDTITIRAELDRLKILQLIGGPAYLADLSSGIPRRLNIESYARLINDDARRRDTFEMTEALGKRALAGEEAAPTLIADTRSWLNQIESRAVAPPMESVAQYLAATYAEVEDVFTLDPKVQGVASGFPWFDDRTGGYVPGRLYVIGARPSMGKTAYAVNTAANLTINAQAPTALFTFEQPKGELLQRLLCGRARGNLTDYIKGRSDDSDRRFIRKAFQDFQAAPLYWDDSFRLTVSQIRGRCLQLSKTLKQEGQELKVVLVDQLSFLNPADVFEKGLRTDQLIGAMTRGLKLMAKELHVAVVLFCQLNRGSTKNKDARPTLTDLKESGSIEENADVVGFLHRAEYYDRFDKDLKGKGEFILAKQRQGPIGTHVLEYYGDSCRWVDLWTPRDSNDEDDGQIPW